MKGFYIPAAFEVIRDPQRCVSCRLCIEQCPNGVHSFDEKRGVLLAEEDRCVDCQRCVAFCPTHALKIWKNDCALRENGNWSQNTVQEIWKQAATGGVLLSSMGNPGTLPVYWDRLLINASQVTNPPIDPLREPMETRVFLGKKPERLRRDDAGRLIPELTPQIELSMPVMFAAMSYGAISFPAHLSLARAAEALGICCNTGEGGLHEDLYRYGAHTIVQVASGRFGVHEDYLNAGAAIEIKMGQGAKPGIGGHLPGAKIVGDVSRTRMIPEGVDAISPAPHHDIYSIEDLRQLIYSLKEATEYKKPIIVKVAAVHNIAAIASGIARGGADIIAIDGCRGGTHENPGQCGHSCGVGTGGGGPAAPGGGHPQSGLPYRGRQHPLRRRCGEGRGAGSRRLLYRYGRAAGAGLPPVPHLPERKMRVGHCHPAAGADKASGPGGGRGPADQSYDCVAA